VGGLRSKKPASPGKSLPPVAAEPKAEVAGRKSTQDITLDAQVMQARAFKDFLQRQDGQKLICQAIRALFDENPANTECRGEQTNKNGTVVYTVTTTDGVAGLYEIEIFGKSADLALKSPNWVERHKFFITLGFNANLEPQILVVDFESMLRTTSQLLPRQDDLLEYITLQHDSELRTFQERVKTGISYFILKASQEQARAEHD
jgi:hypothetical protein